MWTASIPATDVQRAQFSDVTKRTIIFQTDLPPEWRLWPHRILSDGFSPCYIHPWYVAQLVPLAGPPLQLLPLTQQKVQNKH